MLLWKRAALKLAEELNKKWDQAILEQVKEKKSQVAQDRATERNKAGQDAANARRAAREKKDREAREEKERKVKGRHLKFSDNSKGTEKEKKLELLQVRA